MFAESNYPLWVIVIGFGIKEGFLLVRWLIKWASNKKNGLTSQDNPHITIETYNRDMGKTNKDIRDLTKKVDALGKDVAVLKDRSQNSKDRSTDQ